MITQHGDIEQEYAYRPGWLTIILCGLFFGACTAVLAWAATTHQRGMTFRHLFTLSPSEATVFLWVLVAASAGFVLIALALAWHRLTFRQRLALTAAGVVLPAGRWARAETFIAFDSIHRLETLAVQSQRFLHIHHAGGKHTITASMLPSAAVFESVCRHIEARAPR